MKRLFAFLARIPGWVLKSVNAVEPYLPVALEIVTAMQQTGKTGPEKRIAAVEALQGRYPDLPARQIYRLIELAVGALKP